MSKLLASVTLKEFLKSIELEGYYDAFAAANVLDVESLWNMKSAELKTMGLTFGKISKIRAAIAKLAGVPEGQVLRKRKRKSGNGKRKKVKMEASGGSVFKAPADGQPMDTSDLGKSAEPVSKSFTKKPFAEPGAMRGIVRVRLKGVWPSFDKVHRRKIGGLSFCLCSTLIATLFVIFLLFSKSFSK